MAAPIGGKPKEHIKQATSEFFSSKYRNVEDIPVDDLHKVLQPSRITVFV